MQTSTRAIFFSATILAALRLCAKYLQIIVSRLCALKGIRKLVYEQFFFSYNLSGFAPLREIFTNNSYTPLRLKKANAN